MAAARRSPRRRATRASRWCCTTCRAATPQRGERGTACLPGREQRFREDLERAIEYARACRLPAPALHWPAWCPPARSAPRLHATYVANLKHAAAAPAREGMRAADRAAQRSAPSPGFFLTRQRAGRSQVLDEVGADNALLQYDLFHMQIMEGNLAADHRAAAAAHRPHAARRRARPPRARHRRDQLRLPAAATSTASATPGWIGCEYNPAGDTRRRPEVGAALPVDATERSRAALRAFLPARAVLYEEEDTRPVRVRRADRLSAAADGGRAARDRGAGAAHPQDLLCDEGPGGAARRRHRPVRRRAAARRRRAAVDGEIHARAARRPASRASRWCSRACATPRSPRSPAPYGLYYAPDPSSQIACTHRRQRRGELGRRALPQVRPHACTTCCGVRGFTDRRRAGGVRLRRRPMRRATTCSRSPSAPRACWWWSPR